MCDREKDRTRYKDTDFLLLQKWYLLYFLQQAFHISYRYRFIFLRSHCLHCTFLVIVCYYNSNCPLTFREVIRYRPHSISHTFNIGVHSPSAQIFARFVFVTLYGVDQLINTVEWKSHYRNLRTIVLVL